MTPAVVDPRRAARSERHAEFADRPERLPHVRRRPPARHVRLPGLAPVRAPVADARHDRHEVVRCAKRRRQAVVGVEAHGLVFGPEAWIRAKDRACASAVFGIVARQVSQPVRGLVVDGKPPKRNRVDVQIDLGQTAGHRIELVQSPRRLDAE